MASPAQADSGGLLGWLAREHTVAKPGFSRWLVPPAALCVHLCIGQAYAFSVFNLPLTKLIGITESAPHDWTAYRAWLDFQPRHRVPWPLCRLHRHLA